MDMRVLFLSDVPLKDPTSGSERVLNSQVMGMAKAGMDVCTITRMNSKNPMITNNLDGITEAYYGASSQYYALSAFSLFYYPFKFLSYYTRENNLDAVIIHQPWNFFPLALCGKLKNVAKIYVYHSPWHLEYLLSKSENKGLEQKIAATIRKRMERFCLQRTDKIITLSSYMRHVLHSLHEVPLQKIEINPGGVDLCIFKPLENREAEKLKRGFPPGKVHLFTLRNLEPRMGLDRLLKCMAILREAKVNAHLCIGGVGPESAKLQNLIQELAISENVTMAGFIPAELLPNYYGSADFFILPTKKLEGFGLVTPESMACGTPVLGTPVGGTKEILSDFDSKLIFSNTSPEAIAAGIQMAIERCFNDTERYLRLRKKCRSYAELKFSWDRHVDQLTASLKNVWSLKNLNQYRTQI